MSHTNPYLTCQNNVSKLIIVYEQTNRSYPKKTAKTETDKTDKDDDDDGNDDDDDGEGY